MVFALSWHHKTDPDGHHHYDPAHHDDHHQVKKELPCLSHVVLIGDRRKFLSCLVTLKLEVIFSLLLFVCLGSFLNKFDICPGTICRGTKCLLTSQGALLVTLNLELILASFHHRHPHRWYPHHHCQRCHCPLYQCHSDDVNAGERGDARANLEAGELHHWLVQRTGSSRSNHLDHVDHMILFLGSHLHHDVGMNLSLPGLKGRDVRGCACWAWNWSDGCHTGCNNIFLLHISCATFAVILDAGIRFSALFDHVCAGGNRPLQSSSHLKRPAGSEVDASAHRLLHPRYIW